ncbi:MAG: transketolase [Rickettsiales bacterium]|nr:transketolase [Rickettsiales bacterium]
MKYTISQYKELANCIRVLTIDAVEKAKSGHPGMPLGMADFVTVLYSDFLKFNPYDSQWSNRDRLVLSAGHGSMLLYSLLYLTGYSDISLEDIKNFRQIRSKAAGHPEFEMLGAVEVTTGPLGQGVANAVGMALAAKISNSRLNAPLLDHKIYVIAGDGCLMEGISHEAASLAGHLQLDNLVLVYDDNGITIDGKKDLADSENVLDRFRAYNWDVYQIDGHDYQDIHNVLSKIQEAKRPVFISCKTIIGYGSPNKEGTEKCHGSPLGKEEVLLAKRFYHWDSEKSFFIPDDLLKIWRDIGAKSKDVYDHWHKNIHDLDNAQKNLITKNLASYEYKINKAVSDLKRKAIGSDKKATRVSSGDVIEVLNKVIPLCGGSADLTGSNCSKAKDMVEIQANRYSGNYINYGIREHAMGAVMNGIATYGNMFVYGATFLVFSDYMRPAIRMAALMHLPTIYVMTHDSIGLGEDGPTHQPIEQIASLRAMPNLNVFRPADFTETIECWQLALQSKHTPSVLCLTRQSLPNVRLEYIDENLSVKGGYILSDSDSKPEIVILASGSEVSIALEVKSFLGKQGTSVRVISVPCFDLLAEQEHDYIDNIIPSYSIKVVIEAASKFGWERFVGREAIFCCIDSFGKSAPAQDLYDYFGLNVETIVKKILTKVKS